MIELGRMSIHTRAAARDARRRVLRIVGLLGGDEVVASLAATGASEVCRHMIPTADLPDPHVVFRINESSGGVGLRLEFRGDGLGPLVGAIVNLFSEVRPLRGGEAGLLACTGPLSRGAPATAVISQCRALVAEQGREELMAALTETNQELQASFERLRREKSAKQRMESELNIGRDIQMNLLPLVFPPFPERTDFDLYARLRPAREVGGDFYDFFLVNEDQLCFAVGDVSGKGVPAALFAAVTKTLIKSRGSIDRSPGSIVTHANDELAQGNEQAMFVTLWLGILHIPSGRLIYTNGGHNPPLLLRASGELELLETIHGPIVGAMDGLAYDQDEVYLAAGDSLLLFTDGVTEAMDVDGNLYGDERLEALAADMTETTPRAVVLEVLEDVDRYAGAAEQADDITLMALRYAGPDVSEVARIDLSLRNELAEIDRANEAIFEFLQERGVEDTLIFHINMVLDELINNIVSYAYDDEDEHTISLRVDHRPSGIRIRIADDGRPFNPFDAPAPDTTLDMEERDIGGLGIHLVRSVMDDVSYRRNMDGNEVRLLKRLAVPTSNDESVP